MPKFDNKEIKVIGVGEFVPVYSKETVDKYISNIMEQIKAEIQGKIAHYEKRIEPLRHEKLDLQRTNTFNGELHIRNPKEIEFIRYDNRIDGLSDALEIIDKILKKQTGENVD